MKKKVWIWILSVVGVLAITAAVIFVVKPKSPDEGELGEMMEDESIMVQKASEQELGESILVTGKVIPEDEQKIFLDGENGEIQEFYVKENQKVVAGEPLFSYDTKQIDSEYNKAVRARDLLNKRLNIEQNEVYTMGNELVAMKNKLGEEYTQEDINELAKAKLQSEAAIDGTKDEIVSAQETINELVETKKAMTVVSKIEGTIVKIDKNVEKTDSGSNAPVIHIISSGPFKVIGTMSEFDTVRIQPKQPVIIRPKVFKDREWNGTVESISQFPDEEGGGMDEYSGGGGGGNVTMYPFKVAIKDDTKELRQGFHVSIEVKISGDEKFLAIPHMAMAMNEEGQEIVYVVVEGKLQARVIELGEMNDEFMSILSGVEKDELVVVNPNESMHDGMEVDTYDEIE